MKRTAPINVNGAHWSVFGMTGSGKSVLATELITHADRPVIVADSKGDFEWPQTERLSEELRPNLCTSLRELSHNTHRRIIFRPNALENQRDDIWGAMFQFAMDRRNTLVYVDEVYHVTDLRGEALRFYLACLTRGRSLGVFVGSASQRPSRIPLATITEVTHIFAFQLHYSEDRKRLAANAGRDEFSETPQDAYREMLRSKGTPDREIERIVQQDNAAKYAFLYYKVGTEKPQLFKGLTVPQARPPAPVREPLAAGV